MIMSQMGLPLITKREIQTFPRVVLNMWRALRGRQTAESECGLSRSSIQRMYQVFYAWQRHETSHHHIRV